MSKNAPVRMKKVKSNPARNEVLTYGNGEFTDYLKEISNYPALSVVEERELAKRAKEGDVEAKKKLIQSNLRVVITIAKKVIHNTSLPLVDLIQEGNLGLMIAAEKFNYKLGYKFSTYASWWIKQSMFKAISEQSHCMKIPVYIQETLSKFSKVKSEMEKEYNCQVKNQDVAKKMNIEPDKIETFLSAYTKTISIERGLERADGKELNVADILEDEKASVSANVEYENRQIEKEIKKRETERQGLPLASAEKYKARKRPAPETGGEFFKFMQNVTKWGSKEYTNQKAREYKKNFLKGLTARGLDNLDITKEVIKEINSTDNITFFSSGFSYASLGVDFWYDSADAAKSLKRWLDDFKDFKKTYGKE